MNRVYQKLNLIGQVFGLKKTIMFGFNWTGVWIEMFDIFFKNFAFETKIIYMHINICVYINVHVHMHTKYVHVHINHSQTFVLIDKTDSYY